MAFRSLHVLVAASIVTISVPFAGAQSSPQASSQTTSQRTPPPPSTDPPPPNYPAKQAPLLSLDSLSFLEGTWHAESRDGKSQLGTYSFVRQLNRHLLTRTGFLEENCTADTSPVCSHNDLFYVFQDSPGAPLRAIYFDSDGRVIRYTVGTQHKEGAGYRQDLAIFSSDLAAFGPRYRLTYERSTDTRTGKAVLSGSFEILLANGIWHPYLQWSGPGQ